MPTSPHVPEGHFCVGSLECYFKCSRCNLPTAKLQRSSTLWYVYGEYCAAPQTSPHPQMLQLSPENLRTSSHFTALLHSHCRSETLLANRVNKFPFIGVSLTKQKSLSVLHPPLSLVEEHMGCFQVRLESEREWTCAGEAEDGIRVLTTYRPAFLSSIPAVGTETMGSILQTREINEHASVWLCLTSPKYSLPNSGQTIHRNNHRFVK